jgi:hypothetical protein
LLSRGAFDFFEDLFFLAFLDTFVFSVFSGMVTLLCKRLAVTARSLEFEQVGPSLQRNRSLLSSYRCLGFHNPCVGDHIFHIGSVRGTVLYRIAGHFGPLSNRHNRV